MIEIAPATENNMTYDEAVLYCQFLEYNGHRDWRLPTFNEFVIEDDIYGWHLDDTDVDLWPVTPVRDM